MKDLLIQKMSS